MSILFFIVDTFSNKPFHGNPAGVCILPGPVDEKWMQRVAHEVGVSETAFVLKQGHEYELRWFTPQGEIRRCGHASLAAAHILFETGMATMNQVIHFNTPMGKITAEICADHIEMCMPYATATPIAAPKGLSEALGVTPQGVAMSGDDLLVQVATTENVQDMQPNYQALRQLPVRGVVVTAQDLSGKYDFVSRYFTPSIGVNEDPVNGPVQCALGTFWSERLDKKELVAHQASERGGVMRMKIGAEMIYLSAQSVTVLRGKLSAP